MRSDAPPPERIRLGIRATGSWTRTRQPGPSAARRAESASSMATPIQTGENLVDTFEMARAIAARSLDFVMPDVQRIGGVTGWLRAAALAHAHGIDMSSHLFPEFSVHLLGVTPTCHWLEYMDWAVPLLQEPVRVRDGFASIPDRPGAGVEWDEAAVKRYSA
ncbi:MAG: enolase C-terminal domain-like protein [Candidatus Rokuibacteriota bacterium]